MRPFGVVVFSPLLNDDAGLPEGVEDLTVEQFVTEPGIEAFDITVFPRAAWLDIGRPSANG